MAYRFDKPVTLTPQQARAVFDLLEAGVEEHGDDTGLVEPILTALRRQATTMPRRQKDETQ